MENAFDTLALSRKLAAGGFSEEQADTLSSAMLQLYFDNQLVTKSDLLALGDGVEQTLEKLRQDFDQKLENLRQDFDHKLEKLRQDLDHKLENLRQDFDHKLEKLSLDFDRKLEKLRAEIIQWMFGVMIVQSGVTALLFKLMH